MQIRSATLMTEEPTPKELAAWRAGLKPGHEAVVRVRIADPPTQGDIVFVVLDGPAKTYLPIRRSTLLPE